MGEFCKMKKTKIVSTLGPASNSVEVVEDVIENTAKTYFVTAFFICQQN